VIRCGVSVCSVNLAGVDVPAAVAADVEDEPLLREQPEQPDELADERVGVIDAEREDPECVRTSLTT
jgi:hypothetical protein